MADASTFYSTCAGAGAGLFALLFTALQVREAHWRRDHLRVLAAAGALYELFSVVLVSLLALAGHPRWGALLAGIAGLIMTIYYWVAYARTRKPTKFDRVQAWGNGLSFIIYLAVVASSLANRFGSSDVATTFLGESVPYLLVWLIFSGSSEVAYLLMFASDIELQTAAPASAFEGVNEVLPAEVSSPAGRVEGAKRPQREAPAPRGAAAP